MKRFLVGYTCPESRRRRTYVRFASDQATAERRTLRELVEECGVSDLRVVPADVRPSEERGR